MKKNSLFFVMLVLTLTPFTVFAESKTMLCGLDTVTQCAYDTGCMRVTAREVSLPRFIKVDLRKKMISEINAEQPRKTEIKQFEEIDKRYILQGSENGRAWSMVIRNSMGEMSATVSDDLLGFVVFGICTEY